MINLFAFIDWVMSLPLALEQEFQQELSQYEREKRMPYITSVERLATEKGIQQGLLKGIELGLRLKFGSEGLSLLPEISALQDVEQLEAILKGLETVSSMDELRQIYQPPTPH